MRKLIATVFNYSLDGRHWWEARTAGRVIRTARSPCAVVHMIRPFSATSQV